MAADVFVELQAEAAEHAFDAQRTEFGAQWSETQLLDESRWAESGADYRPEHG